MTLRITVLVAGLAMAATAGLAQDGKPSLNGVFSDWQTACDNVRSCTAIGFAADAAGAPGPHLFITRGGAAGDAAKVEIGLGYSEDISALQNGDRVEVAVDGPRALQFEATITKGSEDYAWPNLAFPSERSAAFLQAITQGQRVTISHKGKALGAVSLAGSSAALRWVDDKQKRAGGVTALVARGTKPASAVPAAPALPVVRLAPAISQAGVPAVLPRALAGREDVKLCAGEYDADDSKAPGVSRLSATEYLWEIPCGAGAYNFTGLFIIARRDGSGAHSPGFQSGIEADHLVNGGYDPKTRLLSAFAKGRGLGDCGDEATWAWDGKQFRLTHHAVMSECLGVTSEHWPVIWRARTVG